MENCQLLYAPISFCRVNVLPPDHIVNGVSQTSLQPLPRQNIAPLPSDYINEGEPTDKRRKRRFTDLEQVFIDLKTKNIELKIQKIDFIDLKNLD